MFKISQNLKQRLGVSILGIAFLFFVIFFSMETPFQGIFALCTASIISVALWEFFYIAQARGFNPLHSVAIAGTFAYSSAVLLKMQKTTVSILPEMVLLLILASVFLFHFVKEKNTLANISVTLFGIAYLTVPLSALIAINFFFSTNGMQDGRWWLFYLLAVTKITDTAAFIAGKTFGKHKMAPYISPKKTWEGAFGGVAGGLLTSLLFFIMFALPGNPPMQLSLLQSIGLGLALSLAAQFGDLAESLLKRDAGVKDSNTLPGLGGILDIVDSLIFTAPLLYLFLKYYYS